MRDLAFRRLPGVAIGLAIGAVIGHFLLCYPAITSRGYPSIHPFWEVLAPYLSLSIAFVIPFLDDAWRTRRLAGLLFVPAACLIMGLVAVNLMSARPRIGHLVGVFGLLVGCLPEVLVSGIVHLVLVYPAFLILDTAGAAVWSKCREFTEQAGAGPAVRVSLRACFGIMFLLALGLGGAIWGTKLWTAWPGPHWSDACRSNLRRIGLAVLTYHERYGSFPPAYVSDRDGKPMHSWRVLLLPFLDEQQLYAQYDLNQPWNAPHSIQLATRMPAVYGCRWDDGPLVGHTSYVAVVGAGTAWPGSASTQIAQLQAGTSNTGLFVEFQESGIPWLEPRDLPLTELSRLRTPPPAQARQHCRSGTNVVMADGSIIYVSFEITDEKEFETTFKITARQSRKTP